MTHTLDFGCTCGTLRGQASALSAKTGTHVICTCDDCQAFVGYLGRQELLDAAGGTEIFQIAPRQLTITQGHDQLRCLRLSPKGLYRWYSDCCKTPLANTMASARVAFAGVPVAALHPAERHQEALGPIRARVHARFAIPGSGLEGHPRAPISLLFRFVRLIGGATLRRRHTPSPFFHTDGTPIATPTLISKDDRARIYA